MATCGFLLLFSLALAPSFVYGKDTERVAAASNIHTRRKREWIWNKLHVFEESNATLPQYIGTIKSNIQNHNAIYVLEGDGAGTIFKVDAVTGDISVYERLDREKKQEYSLKALIFDRVTKQPLEPPSTFHIAVYDINDNAPIFVQRLYNGSVSEMSPVGTSVMKVTAVDADDPTLHGHANVSYRVIRGQEFFKIDDSGIISTASPNLDREQKASYDIIVEAIDGKGLKSEESGTATVHIKLDDINDNSPTFEQNTFLFEVSENIPERGEVGRLKVRDIDEPQNRQTKYSFVRGAYQDTFEIIPNPNTNEGIIKAKKQLDFEKISSYRFDIEATDADIHHVYTKLKGPKSIASVTINVKDVDEPPVFSKLSYVFEVQEESTDKNPIGSVHAVDPDRAKRQIRYTIIGSSDFGISNRGFITAKKQLDREEHSWHNITVVANELDGNQIVPRLESNAKVYIKVLDINDNAPTLDLPVQPVQVCENAAPGKVVTLVSATDADELPVDVKFKYVLASEDSNFTLIDNRDNTANVTVKYGQFDRKLVDIHELLIVISDNGVPLKSSTNTLTIEVCKCNEAGEFLCERAEKQTGVSIGALLAIIFVCTVMIIVVLLLIAWKKRHEKDLNILKKNVAEIHEQLVAYDEEGGGEMDTTSYDVSVLNSVRQSAMTSPRITLKDRPCVYSQVQKPPGNGLSGTGEMALVIEMKKDEADNDGDLLPYDTLHLYGYEGTESIAESLSSLGSRSSDSDIDYDFLNDWGPRFKMLAELYGLDPHEELMY
ncbi:cadherin-5 [Hemicordylus capensis]|uniref:cadherin-5 n=1 Tax=Hemicordylus capensis TaxID=884348 RepID=UPI0023041206|nr:cadherin-5 [Hemicordylus capensis]